MGAPRGGKRKIHGERLIPPDRPYPNRPRERTHRVYRTVYPIGETSRISPLCTPHCSYGVQSITFSPRRTTAAPLGHSSLRKPAHMANPAHTAHTAHTHPPTHTPRLSSTSAVDGWVKIPSSSTAVADDAPTTTLRYHVAIDGRFVSVIRHVDGRGHRHLYAIDSICFHGTRVRLLRA